LDKLLITGFSGFVGRYFLEYLALNKIEMEVLGIDSKEPEFDYLQYKNILLVKFVPLDLLNIADFRQVFHDFKPNYILHLASFSSVAYSWNYPVESFANNTNIFLNMTSVVRESKQKVRILSIGSSEQYGDVTKLDIPLKERQQVRPISPYAVARVSQELLAKVFAESYGLEIVLTRSFNHIGPRQDERFVVPSFIKRIAEIKASNLKAGTIETGDIGIVRDFTDVRDVVRAYYLLLMNGRKGEIYNVCSGRGVMLSEMIELIASLLDVQVDTKVNADYVRPNDNKIIIGENFKIRDELGWKPKISLEQSIKDMVSYKFASHFP